MILSKKAQKSSPLSVNGHALSTYTGEDMKQRGHEIICVFRITRGQRFAPLRLRVKNLRPAYSHVFPHLFLARPKQSNSSARTNPHQIADKFSPNSQTR